MDNENTRLINEEPNKMVTSTNNENAKSNSKGKTIAAGAGGFVAGAAVGATSGVMASNSNDNSVISEDQDSQDSNLTPEPDQVILANNEGIRFAHVDADNFSDAFAQAREQVGPGGAFEYNGKIYGTYYAEEWDNMSQQERADYQSRVNDIAPHHLTSTNVTQNNEPIIEVSVENELVSEEPVNNEVHVLGVEAVQTEDGSIMNVALLESGGDHALMVDVDNDGMIEVILHDDNFDGQIQPEEVHDIAQAGIHVNDLLQAQAAQEGDFLAASDDGMPDYINDADSVMEV